MEEPKFKCDACGLCCKKINCEFLTKDNLCSIYENRPLICNVDKGYEVLFKDKISKIEFYKMNEKMCTEFKKEVSK